MNITCLSIVPTKLVQRISNSLGIDEKLINPNKLQGGKTGLVGIVQQLNSQNEKSFDEFTEQDWDDFINEHLSEILDKLDYSRIHDETSIVFNLNKVGLSLNDYIAFVNDNRDILNQPVVITDENRERIELLSLNPVFQLLGNRIGDELFKTNSNTTYLSFPDIKNKQELSHVQTQQSQQQKTITDYVRSFQSVIDRFNRNAVKSANFKKDHTYYIVVDEHGNEFTKSDRKNGIVKFKDENGKYRFGIKITKTVSSFEGEFKGNRYNRIPLILGTNFDTIVRNFFKGEELPLANFGADQVEKIKEQLNQFKEALDKFYEDKGGYHVITDEFPMSGIYYDSQGNKNYIAGTMDMVVVGGDGSIRIFDMKTTRVGSVPGTNPIEQALSGEDIAKYNNQVSIYKSMLEQELERTGMHVDETGLIVCQLYYPKVSADQDGYHNYSVMVDDKSGSELVSVMDENGEYEPISNKIIANIQFNKNSGFIQTLIGLDEEGFKNIGITGFESLTDDEIAEFNTDIRSEFESDSEKDDEPIVENGVIEESDEISEYKKFVDENQPSIESVRPVSNQQIVKIGIATVKYVTYLADLISKDSDGELTRSLLGDKYATRDKKGNLPLYGKQIHQVLSTDKIYRTLFGNVISQFFDTASLNEGSYEYNKAIWINMNYMKILNGAFAELKSINGLKLNAHTSIFEYNETENEDLAEIYELSGEQLEAAIEAYDIDKRTVQFVGSMPTRIKQKLSTMPIYQYDENGNVEYDEDGNPIISTDENGMPRFLDIHFVSAFLASEIGAMRTKSKMMQRMQELKESNPWIEQVIQLLDNRDANDAYDPDFSKSFFSTFRKSKNLYISIYEQEDGQEYQKYAMKPLGGGAKAQKLIDDINDKLLNGIHTTKSLFQLSDDEKDGDDVMVVNKDRLDTFRRMIQRFNEPASRYSRPRTNVDALLQMFDMLGIKVDHESHITQSSLSNDNSRVGNALYESMMQIYNILSKSDGKVTLSDPELSEQFRNIAKSVEFAMDETNDVSVRSGGKSYQRYTEPSFIQDTIDEIKQRNLTQSEKDVVNGIPSILVNPKSRYLRFRQFRRMQDGAPVFVNSWFNEIRNNPKLIKYLNHYIHTSTNDEQYMRQGDRDYTMSMIKAFFAPQEEFNLFGEYGPSEKNVALFRVPIYSDKNSQEWISFRPIGSAMVDTSQQKYDDNFYDDFSDAVFEYFLYEIDRMRSVLRQLRKPELKKNDIANFNVKRIENDPLTRSYNVTTTDENGKTVTETKFYEITFDDLLDKNGKLDKRFAKSGLSFRYLSYLNEHIERKTAFGKAILTLLNGENNLTEIQDSEGNTISPQDRFENAKQYVSTNFQEIYKAHMEQQFDQFLQMIDQMFSKKDSKGNVKHWYENDEFVGITQKFAPNKKSMSYDQLKRMMRWMFYNDNISSMNIVNMTVTDPAFNKDTIDFQKRFSQVHSQTQRLDKENEFNIDGVNKRYSDGVFRFVTVNDQIVTSDLRHVIKKVFSDLAKENKSNPVLKQRYELLSKTIPDMFDTSTGDGVNVTDGQAYNSPTSLWKKLGMLGQSSPEFNEAYQKIRQGDFSLGNINIVLQSLKPFVYGFSEMFDDSVYTGSENNTRLVPVQLKDSESLIILAGAIMEGANVKSPLRAIFEFMEDTAFDGSHDLKNYNSRGIDTIVFKSGVKVGGSGVLDIAGKTYDEVKSELSKCIKEDGLYDPTYVHEMDFDSFGIQQNVPAHMQNHYQPLGSQMAVLDFTDMPETLDETTVLYDPNVKGPNKFRTFTNSSEFIKAYNALRKEDMGAGIYSLMKKFGCVKRNGKYVINKNKFNLYLSQKLSDKIVNDAKYSQELYRAFSMLFNSNGNYEFIVPIGDPAIADVVYSTLFTEIRDSINKEDVPGGPVVQMSPFGISGELRIKDSNGNVIKVDKNGTIRGFKYTDGLIFESYVTCPTAQFEQKITKPDGTLMTMDEIKSEVAKGNISQQEFDAATKMIAYRIPTEDKYSIYRCEVVGFIPRQEGELVILPKELTTLSGTDFDIDKLYCWFKMTDENVSSIKDTQQRTRMQKRNYMFDYHWEAAKQKSSVEKQLYPGGYDILKKLAEQVNPGFKSGDQNIFMMHTQVALRKLNAAGKNFVGIAALNNVCHGLSSFCKIKVKNMPEFIINGVSSREYQESDGSFIVDPINSKFDQSRISRTLSMFVGASADNAKEALLGALNITPTTANYAMTMIRLGIPIETVVYIMNNPSIKELSQLAENTGKSFERLISKEHQDRKIGNTLYNITNDGLLKRINGEDSSQSVDNAVIKMLFDITSVCRDVSSLNTLLSLNSIKNSIGPSIADAIQKKMQLQKLKNDVNSGLSSFQSDTWDNIMENIPFMQHLVDCYGTTINTLCKTFSPVFTDEFNQILNKMSKDGVRFDEKTIRNLISQYLLFKGKAGGLFGSSNEFLMHKFPQLFQQSRSKYNDNDFVRSLFVEDMTNKMSIPAIKYRNADSTRERTDMMSASWAGLVSRKDQGSKNLSRYLYEYMVTRFGFSWMPYSASSIAPIEAKLALEKDDLHDMSFWELFDPQKERLDSLQLSRFIEQFYRNNPKCGAFVQSDQIKTRMFKDGEGNYVPVISDNEVSENTYGVATKYYKSIFTIMRDDLGKPMVVKDDDGNSYVMLKQTQRLGIDNNFAEYNPNGIEESIVSSLISESKTSRPGIQSDRREDSSQQEPQVQQQRSSQVVMKDTQEMDSMTRYQQLLRNQEFPFLGWMSEQFDRQMEIGDLSSSDIIKSQLKRLQSPSAMKIIADNYYKDNHISISSQEIQDKIDKINKEIQDIKKDLC